MNATARRATWITALLSKFPAFDLAWSEEIKARWFEGFGQLWNMMEDCHSQEESETEAPK